MQGRTWLAIGNFDGVHLGHQLLFERLRYEAEEDGSQAGVLTFHPHPRVFLQNISSRFYLTEPEEKIDLLREAGISNNYCIPFDRALANLSSEAFFARLLEHFALRGLVVGEDFVLGKNRSGTMDVISGICERKNIRLVQMPAVAYRHKRISSSRIRQVLVDGNVQLAASLLGRYYSVHGKVLPGKKLGRKLGLPTANVIASPSKVLPRYGIYATWAYVQGKKLAGVTSVGVRPTVEVNGKPIIETLLLNFNDNIYNQDLKVEFVQFLRDEIKFPNLEALAHQIEKDRDQAGRILNHDTHP